MRFLQSLFGRSAEPNEVKSWYTLLKELKRQGVLK